MFILFINTTHNIMSLFIKFARQSNFNMFQCLFVCLFACDKYIQSLRVFGYRSSYKFSEPVQGNDNNLPVVKVSNFVNNDTIKENDYGTITKLNAIMKGPLKFNERSS